MIFELIGMLLGALVGGYIVFSVIAIGLDAITRYRLKITTSLNWTLALSIIFALFWGSFWGLSPDRSIIQYVPGLIIIYLFERRRRLTQKCPHCKERIKADATRCRHCQSSLTTALNTDHDIDIETGR
ncbi:hypothetical protein CVD25_01155 [Bacillus canaveralius]|uniref:Zinc ribbon domain-containing protein n=1 Tax=Bacillus canaveralius TaxID=1403243 RepID=A0A2N5GPR6_9BACI|nr:hypothetical protein [Bacillus canaveralius]PLR84672.1 hypothetical protein CU635_06265 [Bacillus canaveralius]PLS00824.1 hypothetical protein CVD25_01155 [Bacillus canaveralius]